MIGDDIIINGSRAIARSYAKINLTLDVLGRREDGYHDVRMVMQTVSLADWITISKCHSDISVSTNLPYLPNNDKNIAAIAAREFYNYTGRNGGCKIKSRKYIPVAAGLAGGSGNAAAVLCALNKLYNTGLTMEELCSIGRRIGADVPYCIMGCTALAEGIGEKLTPLAPMPKATILLVRPDINISTKDIYEAIDSEEISKRPDTDAMILALENGDLNAIASNLSNVMGTFIEREYPIVKGIRRKMMINGAIGAVMSGSGPTVFGIFDDFYTAKRSHDSFAHQFREVYLASTL